MTHCSHTGAALYYCFFLTDHYKTAYHGPLFWFLKKQSVQSNQNNIKARGIIEVHRYNIFMYLFPPWGSKSQSALWNAITAGMGIKGKEQKPLLNDPRSLEEILAEDLPLADEPDATEKTAIRFVSARLLL